MQGSGNFNPDPAIRVKDFRIGCIGAGMIMAECHLAAYRQAGFPVVAIASRSPEKAAAVAQRWEIPTVHKTPSDLVRDPQVEILDIAFPPGPAAGIDPGSAEAAPYQGNSGAEATGPDTQRSPGIERRSRQCRQDPLGQSEHALRPVDAGAETDPRPPRTWRRGDGDDRNAGYPALAGIPGRLRSPDACQHERPSSRCATLPVRRPGIDHHGRADRSRTQFAHKDGITVSTLMFPNGVLAVSMEDVWSGPREEGFDSDIYIKWRVEGTDGVAQGTIGWPDGSPSTLRYASKTTTGGQWVSPTWETMWFPHAFIGVMEQLQYAVKSGEPPALSVADNVKTVALVEAGYRSIAERRTVRLSEIEIQ